jgi:hypothetical protein
MKLQSQMKKFDQELQIVWGEVYAPDIPDSQGDFMTADEIRLMAYRFMREGFLGQVDINHNNKLCGCWIVESFIARDGDDLFIPGAWVVAIHIPELELWQAVKNGDLNGLSMEGLAMATETTLELEIPEKISGKTDEVAGHVHKFTVAFGSKGEFLGGETTEVDGHKHVILKGTITEDAQGHHHRFNFVDELTYAQS